MSINHHFHKARQNAKDRWQKSSRYDKFMFSLAIAYLLAICGFMVWHRNFFSPDQFFVFALVAALLLGRVKTFLWDWVPLMLLLFGYEYIRGLVPLVNKHVHVHLMIYFDQFVFGTVPTVNLQSRFYTPGHPHWYDYAAVCLYLLHFIVPMMVAFIFWLKNRQLFRQYASAMVLLSYLTYLTYLAFPAAPPWMAADAGFLPHVTKIMDVTFAHFSQPIQMPTVYRYFGENLMAAVPSLHAAYPLLTALFVGKRVPKLIPLLIVYVLAVWVAVVYLGEHYAFDVFLGIIYALFAYAVAVHWKNITGWFAKPKRAIVPD